jgi:hypothetical protein
MISCKLQGGLGNQMFQISAAHALALRNNDLACFNLSTCYTPLQGNEANMYSDTLFSKLCNTKNLNIEKIYNEPKFSFDEIKYEDNLQLNGYFQSEKYFSDYKKEIIDLFQLPTNKIEKPINNLTSVHVRRGDYLKLQDYHSVLSKDYYLKAMDIIGGNFIFFSDDMDWVKDNFKGDNIIYSNNYDETLDMTLMSLCDNNIIANSSFSWWGAYLNKNENKRVIAPKNWFGLTGPKDIQDIYPKDWIILDK